jgi:hypothetical protein
MGTSAYNVYICMRNVLMINYLHKSINLNTGGFAPSFINYKKWCTRLAATHDKAYQLLAQGTPASSTTKTCRSLFVLLYFFF